MILGLDDARRILAPIQNASDAERKRLWWDFDARVFEDAPSPSSVEPRVTELHVQRARCLVWHLIGDKLAHEKDEFELIVRIAYGIAEAEALGRKESV